MSTAIDLKMHCGIGLLGEPIAKMIERLERETFEQVTDNHLLSIEIGLRFIDT